MSMCEKDVCGGNQLRALLARSKKGNMLTDTYLRWCDKCNTVYILKPGEMILEEIEIPLLEYQRLHQMEMI